MKDLLCFIIYILTVFINVGVQWLITLILGKSIGEFTFILLPIVFIGGCYVFYKLCNRYLKYVLSRACSSKLLYCFTALLLPIFAFLIIVSFLNFLDGRLMLLYLVVYTLLSLLSIYSNYRKES